MNDQPNSITAALREAAFLLDQHPALPQPYITSSSSGRVSLSWYLHHDGGAATQKATAAEIVRSIDGTWNKSEHAYNETLGFSQQRGLLDLHIQVDRPAVCERVVVGTETRTIPAVEAQPAQPERVETVEKVEWRCQPLLAETESAVA